MPLVADATLPAHERRRTVLRSIAYLLCAFPLVLITYQGLPVPLVPHVPFAFGAPTAVLQPQGPQQWNATQWQAAQAIYVGVTLVACAGLLWSLHRRGKP